MKSMPMPMPAVYVRRPYEDDKPGEYQESFRDWAANNRDAVTWFLENAALIAQAVNEHAALCAVAEAAEALMQALNIQAIVLTSEQIEAARGDVMVAQLQSQKSIAALAAVRKGAQS